MAFVGLVMFALLAWEPRPLTEPLTDPVNRLGAYGAIACERLRCPKRD